VVSETDFYWSMLAATVLLRAPTSER